MMDTKHDATEELADDHQFVSLDGSHRTLRGHVVGQLREAITDGRLVPGTWLRTKELADELGVSRIPVREALHTLEAEGLVEFHPHRGAVVASLSAQEVTEIFLLRRQLEPFAARIAVERKPADLVERLTRLVEEMETVEVNPSAWIDLDRVFHMTLYQATDYQRLCKIIEQLRASIERYVRLYILAPRNIPQSHVRHREILEACARGDAERAEQATREHLVEVEGIFLNELEQPRIRGQD